jgi:hypothetical protein
MSCARTTLRTLLLVAFALAVGACTTTPQRTEPAPAAGAVLRSLQLDRATEDRISPSTPST